MTDPDNVHFTVEPSEVRAEGFLAWDLSHFEPKAADVAVVPARVVEPLFEAGHVYQLYGALAVTGRHQGLFMFL
jgi:hypothetical protein